MRNSPADTQAREEGGGGGSSGSTAETPLQPVEKTVEKQIVPLQPIKDHTGADIHTAAHGDPTLEQISTQQPKEDHTRVDIHTAAQGGPHQSGYPHGSPRRTTPERISTRQPKEDRMLEQVNML
ncbi:acid sphingomyelinase-like phosphodiesterase 3b [Grus japonensis]|uniref:Acid sphingomyelinase-like phosphodiesterase 3b n=1 Tax=Grus japonensis TaxID=30415 RepID=A0ABC9WWA8_GRUJA